jgi:hypothetical protein
LGRWVELGVVVKQQLPDSGQTSWDAAQRTGSRGIFVWESTDLINWGNERLVVVEDATAGMVWAPEAIWDPAKGMLPFGRNQTA